MSRINCHSAFEHYEMFHSRGGDVINIGSNNTTIFNMGAGFGNFGGGSFWSGLGYGLGNGLGSIFGGLFGGNMGGYGNYGYGMSPFGMGGFSPFGNMGTWWNSMSAGGGASSRKSADNDCTCHCKHDKASNDKCDDPDQKKLEELGAKVNKLETKKGATPDEAKKLLDDLNSAKDASKTEGHHNNSDPVKFQNWIDNLTDYIKKNGWQSILDPKAAKAEAKPDAKADVKADVKPDAKAEAKPDANNASAETITEPWSNISAWNNDRSLIPDHITLPDGYSKLASNETIENIDRVHDNSGKTDDVKGETKKSTETYKAQSENTTFPTYLAITTGANKTYNYKTIGMSNGYPIYGTPQSDENKNVYVMCKEKSTGKVVLLQFKYKVGDHLKKISGYGVKDAQN